MAAPSDQQPFELATLDPTGMLDSKPLFSHVATASGDMKVVFVAGQVGMDERGRVAPTYEGQVEQTLRNLSRCLEAAGARVTDVVKMNYYIVKYHPDHRPHVPLVLRFLDGHRPATMLVPVAQLARPEFLFEMDLTAVVPRDRAAGGGGGGVPRPVPQFAEDVGVDVVVVGGGLAGLQAGLACQDAGLSTLVLEARDRVGGKTWSVPGAKGKGMIELGAAWINDTNQSHMYALARRLRLDLLQQLTAGDCVVHDLDGSLNKFVYGEVPPVGYLLCCVPGSANRRGRRGSSTGTDR